MLWGILSLASLAITIMHPRIHYGFIFIFCFVLLLKSIFARKQFKSKSFLDTTIGGILLIIVLLYVGSPLNILYPYHAPYETLFFPGMSAIPDDEKKNVCVIMTLVEEYGHGDYHYSGIYYNIEEEYICFFAY